MLLFAHVGASPQWQVKALMRSKLLVSQQGRMALRFDTHPESWRYPILDRVLAFHRAMHFYAGDQPVAILDPDMVFLRPLEPTVESHWGQASAHPVMEADRKAKAQQLAHLVDDALRMPLVDLPWLLSAGDARRLAPRWLEFTERMVLDPPIRSLFGWMLDMWSFCLAAYSLGIAQDVSTRLTCVPGEDSVIGDAWVLHYHRALVHGFDKRIWMPGDPLEPVPTDEPYEALRSALL